MPSKHACAQMSDKTMQTVLSIERLVASEKVLGLVVHLRRLVDFHFVVAVWLVHVWENPITRSFHVVVALSQRALRLLGSKSHRLYHHDAFRICIRSCWLCNSRLLLNSKRNLDCWILDVLEEPHRGRICIAIACVVDGMLRLYFWDTHLQQLVDDFHIQFWINFTILASSFAWHSLLVWLYAVALESVKVEVLRWIKFYTDLQLFGHPVVHHKPLDNNQ